MHKQILPRYQGTSALDCLTLLKGLVMADLPVGQAVLILLAMSSNILSSLYKSGKALTVAADHG